MPSNKDTKKKLPEILDKFASNSEKATKQLGEMSSQLSAFVDMLSENVQKESRRRDTEDRRREKARAVRAQRDAEREVEKKTNKAEKDKKYADAKAEKDKKDADAAAAKLEKSRNEYAKAVKGLAQLDKDEIKKSKQKAKQKETDKLKEQQKERQQKIGELKQKGTPYSDIANKNLSSGNILGGLFASIFAIKDVSNKRKLSSLEEDEKEYNKQQEERNAQENEDQEKETEADLKQKRLEEKKKLQESVTKLQGSEKPAASVSPSKITNPGDQIVAETIKLNDEDKLEQSQEQTKRLGTLDEDISRIWTDHLQVTVADISDPAIDKLKKAIGGGAPAAAGSLGGLANLGIAAAMAAILPEILTVAAIGLVLAAVWLGLEKGGYLGKMQDFVMDSADKAKTGIKETVVDVKKFLGFPEETKKPLSGSIRNAISGVYNDEKATDALEQLVVSESSGDPGIINKKGRKKGAGAAAGLFQFIPSTAIAMAKQYKEKNPGDTAFDKLIDSKGNPDETTDIVAGLSVENQVILQKQYVEPLIKRVQKAAGDNTTLPTYAQMKSFQFAGGFDPGNPDRALFDSSSNNAGTGKPAIDKNPELKKIADANNGVVTNRTLQEYFERSDNQPKISKFSNNGSPKRITKKQLDNMSEGEVKNLGGQYNIGIEGVLDNGSLLAPSREKELQKYIQYNESGKSQLDDLNKQAYELNQHITSPGNPDKLQTIESEIKTLKQNIQYNDNIIKNLESAPQASASPPQTGVNVVAAMENKAGTEGGNPVTIAPITTNNVIAGAKSGDGLPYRDVRDYINKAINPDVFGIVTRSSAN